VVRLLDHNSIGSFIAFAAGIALPSVILTMTYGQTRIFFTMSRDGLLPSKLAKIHPRFHTPHVITLITGTFVALFGALFPVGILADITNSGTLFAFIMVAIGVLILRRTQPDRPRPFRTPLPWLICPLAVIGCLLLFLNLSKEAKITFFVWGAIGLVVYYLYGYRKSHLANGTEPS
jgi:basic amino acid/polyamine antiporter, APA family